MGKHTEQVTQRVRAIPRHALARKLTRTLTGLAFVGAAGAVLRWLPAAPWWVALGLFGVGAHIVSGELVERTLQYFLALAKDVVALVTGARP